MADNSTDPLVSALIGVVVGALLSTTLSSAYTRTQTLQQERRTAYADLLGTASTCESQYTEAALRTVEPIVRPEDLDKLFSVTQIVFDCQRRLGAAGAKVRILSDNPRVADATWRLMRAIPSPGAKDEERDREYHEYFEASARFEGIATREANKGLTSLLLSSVWGLRTLLVLFLVGFLALYITGRRTLRKTATPAERLGREAESED